ncbi:MAG: hypothetical protein JNM72_25695 [Deltaproteobacteria bacterium]|jgi:hypothetical protein|nr:hypothetical protein [Deltaproteobacteria bacterium]
MNLTLALAMLAKQLTAPEIPVTEPVLVEIVGEGDTARVELHLDSVGEALVIEASPRSWQRLSRVLDADPRASDAMVLIHLPGKARASALAPMLQASFAHLDVTADGRTNSIFLSALEA